MQTQTRPDDLKRRLRRLRLAAGMSQSDVGKNIGLPRSAVTQIELGNRDLSADELVRFAAAFQRSPTALLTPSNEFDNDQNPEDDEVLIEFQDAVKSSGESLELCASLKQITQIAKELTRIENHIGIDVYGPEAVAFLGTPPRSTWEATHHGITVAEEERRRLDLGSAPIRDLPELLATLRVRASRLELSPRTLSLFIHRKSTGPIVIVNKSASVEERRFRFAHGLAHLLFDRDHRWIICDQKHANHHHEIRANAFATAFLVPPAGLQRYLQSMGRDTMARRFDRVMDLIADASTTNPPYHSRIRVNPRSHQGNRDINGYELSQIASYFGVTTSLAAYSLKNLRHLTSDKADQLTSSEGQRRSTEARQWIRSSDLERDVNYDPFVSRLLGLFIEGQRHGFITPDEVGAIGKLIGLSEEKQATLFDSLNDYAPATATAPKVDSDLNLQK